MLLALNAVLASNPVLAAEEEPGAFEPRLHCPLVSDDFRPDGLPPQDPNAQPGTVLVEADSAELLNAGTSRLTGNVSIQRDTEFLIGESVEFNAETGAVRSELPVRFGDADIAVNASRVEYNTSDGSGYFDDVDFLVPSRPARGNADRLERHSETESSMQGVMYTTCPPEDEDWTLRASSMHIDQESGRGTGRNVRLAFMSVPFFYTPWIQFPIDDRRMTGLLYPEYGNSGRLGDWYRQPFYWNIAPNADATLSYMYTKKRGPRFDTELRHLWSRGKSSIDLQYLQEDRVTGENRYKGELRNRLLLPGGWNTSLRYNELSDKTYYEDFSQNGRATAVSYVPSDFILAKSGMNYSFLTRYQQYETVDPTLADTRHPYQTWPNIRFNYADSIGSDIVELGFNADLTDFRHATKIHGQRHHVEPRIALDFSAPGYFAIPSVALNHTRYDLERQDGTQLEITRDVPVGSLDLGLILERDLTGGGLQTLEPRLFYLNVPYEDQADIPLFDTRAATVSLDSLFRDDRFSGLDRIGDTEQMTAGIGTSWLEAETYRTWLSFRVAQAFYLRDRRVQLDTAAPDTESTSDLFAEVEYSPIEQSSLRLTASWDDTEEKVGIAAIRYQYKADSQTVFNASYRFQRNLRASPTLNEPLEQASISFATPIGGRWRLFGKTVYSIPEEGSLENLAGFEYESCCWTFRVVNRRYIFNRDGDFDQALWLQLSLKGLSSVGRAVDELLMEDIHGYGN